MAGYRALARRYRPLNFDEILGQEAIVTTLKNSLSQTRLAHAYLFSGSRGTGKTTLARILARALNCTERVGGMNPCNECSSCMEITQGHSLDVLEIDGASHRGIEDVRQINETVGYASARGKYKIYIIDEVHMLTKEAFNALLKTLEEPPNNVIFMFATTEPHKVLPTILSRCQHFQLSRLDDSLIARKLKREAADLGVIIDDEATHLICQKADGSMRDAESLLDQLISFHGENLDGKRAADALGLVTSDLFFKLDSAAQNYALSQAFEIADDIFRSGKSPLHFVEGLAQHYRNRLLVHLGLQPRVTPNDLKRYQSSVTSFDREQCLLLIDTLIPALESLKSAVSVRLFLESLLLQVIRMYRRLPLEILTQRLLDLESRLHAQPTLPSTTTASQSMECQQATPLPHPQTDANSTLLSSSTASSRDEVLKQQNRYNTLLRFAALELDGALEN